MLLKEQAEIIMKKVDKNDIEDGLCPTDFRYGCKECIIYRQTGLFCVQLDHETEAERIDQVYHVAKVYLKSL